ncbi:hypothetical protein ABTM71_19765, partial [Acinetobacter baumannii]
ADFTYFVSSSPCAVSIGTTRYPTVSTELAHASGSCDGEFAPDFAVDPNSIARLSGRALLDGKVSIGDIRDKQIFVVNVSQMPSA